MSSPERFVFVAALGAAGCFGNTSTEFPPGLEPLEDNEAPEAGPPYDEGLVMVDGDNGNWAWVHGRAYLAGAPADVWATLKDPELLVGRCSSDAYAFEVGVEPDYEMSFQVSYTVDEIITVEWDELWRYGTVEGAPEDPSLAMIRYQKVEGSELIRLIEGSIQLHATDEPGVTELQLIEHVNAAGGGIEDMRKAMQYRIDSVTAVLGGGEQPDCP